MSEKKDTVLDSKHYYEDTIKEIKKLNNDLDLVINEMYSIKKSLRKNSFSEMKEGTKIFEAIPKIMAEMKAVAKIKKQGLNFPSRGIDDVYNGIQEAVAKNGVFNTFKVTKSSSKEVKSRQGNLGLHREMTIVFTFFAEDGSSVEAEVECESIDYGDKGISQCLSLAHKQALQVVFMIPTMKNEEKTNNQGSVQQRSQNSSQNQRPRGSEANPNGASKTNTPPDSSGGDSQPKDETPITEPQMKRLFAFMKEKGWVKADLDKILRKVGIGSTTKIPKYRYEGLIDHISKHPMQDKKEELTKGEVPLSKDEEKQLKQESTNELDEALKD